MTRGVYIPKFLPIPICNQFNWVETVSSSGDRNSQSATKRTKVCALPWTLLHEPWPGWNSWWTLLHEPIRVHPIFSLCSKCSPQAATYWLFPPLRMARLIMTWSLAFSITAPTLWKRPPWRGAPEVMSHIDEMQNTLSLLPVFPMGCQVQLAILDQPYTRTIHKLIHWSLIQKVYF